MIQRRIDIIESDLVLKPRRWLVTGAAGFIGSHLVEKLLKLGQKVTGLDNFSTGSYRNLETVRNTISHNEWLSFHFKEGDIRSPIDCEEACQDVDYVLHQAAIGSVGRSIKDPQLSNSNNIDGFLNMLVAAKNAKVKNFVYASSSSVYGDHEALPKIEPIVGALLSPYAVTKSTNESYANVFFRVYGLNTIGLRYFNVFGPRQDPDGSYAAVIPRWLNKMLNAEEIEINGDGKTSRDFCYIDNVVQANILASLAEESARNQIYNIAYGEKIELNELFQEMVSFIQAFNISYLTPPKYREFRVGDVRHSLANIEKAKALLGYEPIMDVRGGLQSLIKSIVDGKK